MKLITKTAIAAALSAIALSASAMTPIQDADLSQVSGQDGVSIAADLHVNVGSFKYTDGDATGGSVSFNNIALSGTFAMTLDIINNTAFNSAAFGAALTVGNLGVAGGADVLAYKTAFGTSLATAGVTVATASAVQLSAAQTAGGTAVTIANGGPGAAATAALAQVAAVGGFAPGGDVVKIAIPQIAVASGHELNMSVASITMGGTATPASYGSFAMNNIQLQGTTVYIWAH